jgi:hypothetical protein
MVSKKPKTLKGLFSDSRSTLEARLNVLPSLVVCPLWSTWSGWNDIPRVFRLFEHLFGKKILLTKIMNNISEKLNIQ